MDTNLDDKVIYRGLVITSVDPGRLTPDRSGVTTCIKGTIGGHPFDVDVTLALHANTAEFNNDDDRTCFDAYVDLIHQHSEDLVEAAEGCAAFREIATH
jgi:hypothetical protein